MRLIKYFILISLLFSIPELNAQQQIDDWKKDIKFLADELVKKHKNAFAEISEKDFNERVEKIISGCNNYKYSDFIASLYEITGMIKDGHTNIRPKNDPALYSIPIIGKWFPEGYFIISAGEEYKQFLGQKLIAVNDVPIEEVLTRLSKYIGHENKYWLKEMFPRYMRFTCLLAKEKITGDLTKLTYTFDKAGPIEIKAVNEIQSSKMVSLEKSGNISVHPITSRNSKNYHFTYLPKENSVYFQYNVCANDRNNPMEKFSDSLITVVEQKGVNKLIIDLRYNSGGNSSVLWSFYNRLKRSPFLLMGRIYVLIGNYTFSSGLLAAVDLKNRFKIIFVGEPTGQKPNSYGEVNSFQLPFCKYVINYSTKYFELDPGNNKDSFYPDVIIKREFPDYIQGKDPVFDYVINR